MLVKKQQMIYIGADHAGFALKEIVKKYLVRTGRTFMDLGAAEFDERDDYPDFAKRVARAVVIDEGKGILICGSGIGMCIAANKVAGARAVNAESEKIARISREHNDANILCLGGRTIAPQKAKKIIKAWLDASFNGLPRYKRRIKGLSPNGVFGKIPKFR